MTKNDIANKVRKAMQDKQITPYFLIHKKKIHSSEVYSVLQIGVSAKRNYRIETLIKICDAVGCDLLNN